MYLFTDYDLAEYEKPGFLVSQREKCNESLKRKRREGEGEGERRGGEGEVRRRGRGMGR